MYGMKICKVEDQSEEECEYKKIKINKLGFLNVFLQNLNTYRYFSVCIQMQTEGFKIN